MKIVALDLATVTGVAVGSPNSDPVSWSVDLGKGLKSLKGDDKNDLIFSKALVLTDTLIREHQPDFVAIEAAVGGPKTSHFLVGLLACVRGCVANRKVDRQIYAISAIRKHFTGRAWTTKDFPALSRPAAKRAIKQEVIKRCHLLGWEPEDDNAADALALLDYALAKNTSHQARVAGGLL